MSRTFTIAIGSDHAGFAYKEAIKAMLLADGHTVRDFGTHSDASCDYPDWIRPAAEAVGRGEFERGIVLGGIGAGHGQHWQRRFVCTGCLFTYRESRRLRNICCVLAAICFELTKNAPGLSFPCRSLTRPRDGE